MQELTSGEAESQLTTDNGLMTNDVTLPFRRRRLHMNRAGIFLATILATLVPGALIVHADDRLPATVAERSEFHATARHDEVLTFIGELAERSALVRRLDFGTTVEGRPLTAVVASNPTVTSAKQAADSNKLIVLLIGNIHAGECDGKEALLALARDLAFDPDHPLLRDLVLVLVPNLNADGNERMAANNRPGQIGPDITGRRENAQGLDLNRDFVKLETPEVQALVRLVNEWNPHVFIDCHTTNGSRHRYALTFDSPHNPAGPLAPREFAREVMLPEVMRRLEAKGTSTFFYGNFDRERTSWVSYGHEPRYGIEYVGLRGRIAILAESYSYNSYRARVEATHAFVRECLNYLAERRQTVTELLRQAERQAQSAGTTQNERVAIRSKLVARPDKVVVKGFELESSPNEPAPPGTEIHATQEQRRPNDYTVEHVDLCVPTRDVPWPLAYLIPQHESRVADKLLQHGVKLVQLATPVSCEVEVYTIDKLETAQTPFQRHRLRTADVNARREQRQLAAATYVVPAGQSVGSLAAYLLEPASDDGLVTWNQLDHVIRSGQDYPVLRLVQAAQLSVHPVQQVPPALRLDLDQIYGPEHTIALGGAAAAPPHWLPGRPDYIERVGTRLMQTNAETTESRPFHDSAIMERTFGELTGVSAADARALANRTNFDFNSDASAALISHDDDLYCYDFAQGKAMRLTTTPEPEEHASFSPDGKRVAFVRKHNLYVVDVGTAQERALTTDGNDKLLFGELDWVYQEELYGRGNFKGYWWSPDSSRIALLRLDESDVKPFTVVDHIPVRQELEVSPYPKAGDPNPTVALGTVAAAGGPVHWMDISQYESVQPLIVRAGWTPDSRRVMFQVQNREQTWLDLVTADPESGRAQRVLREASSGWVEVLGVPRWLDDGSFLWLSERSGSRHIYRITADGSDTKPLTAGPWEVQGLEGIDPENGWVYFTAIKDSPVGTHVYRVRLDGSSMERLTQRPGNHAASFDDSFGFFFDTFSDAHTPPQVWLCAADGTAVRAIEPNPADHLRHYRINRPEFRQIEARDGFQLETMLIRPPDFDPSKKYPVLCYVYSGPQAPVVRDRWGGSTYLWHQMLAQEGYVIWMCDNRSASTKGIAAALRIHRNLGQYELEDIEDGLAWLKRQPWVDHERIGIWGWSYGGYMTCYALTHSKEFKLGIAGAPVTDWRNYDTIYTERYMGLPENNEQGYKTSSAVEAAANLHGRLLLIHGTVDDNVHLSNTIQLAGALQRAGKQFDLMLYPKSRHGVTDPHQVRHMRELMTRFIRQNL
jgi:dipeptidyl aminopeptidase/acylaminoacyl peptidase